MKIPLISAAALLAGCASTTILPEGNGQYSLVSTSASESSAIHDAKSKATEECTKQGKHLKVLKYKSIYQGMDKNERAVLNLAQNLLKKDNTPNIGPDSSDDYKVTMKFKCY